MTFKERLAADVGKIFLNTLEFADIHNIDGREMPVLIETNEQLARTKRFNQHIDGVYLDQIVVYVAAADFARPLPGQHSYLTFDGIKHRVEQATEEDGMFILILSAATPATSGAQIRQRGTRYGPI